MLMGSFLDSFMSPSRLRFPHSTSCFWWLSTCQLRQMQGGMLIDIVGVGGDGLGAREV